MTGIRTLAPVRGHATGALVLAVAIVLPRSLSIADAHSECFDARYHVERGLAYLSGTVVEKGLILNDPPLGEGLLALPVLATNVMDGEDPLNPNLYTIPGRAERLSLRIAGWKALLFLPLVAVGFLWCARLYGLRSAWLASGILVLDPTFAAHVPVIALDTLGATGVVVSCYLIWRWVEEPALSRLVAAGVAMGVALMLKHTAVPLPFVAFALALLYWAAERLAVTDGEVKRHRALAPLAAKCGATVIVAALTVWGLCGFDVRTPPLFYPAPHLSDATPIEVTPDYPRLPDDARGEIKTLLRLTSPWPAGLYAHSLIQAVGHGMTGHPGYLWGEKRPRGWWYYFPAVALYKVPVGLAVLLGLGVASILRTPPRLAEWSLLLPALTWALFLATSGINVGFRHALVPYAFLLLFSSRIVARPGRVRTVVAGLSVALAGLHGASYHPDYLSYINAPRREPYLAVSDSNVDWGQSLKQVRRWIDLGQTPSRPITLAYFGQVADRAMLRYYLDDRVKVLQAGDSAPERGLLVISPVLLAGVYDPQDTFAALRVHPPIDAIGHCMLVYDLDALRARGFSWSLADDAQ